MSTINNNSSNESSALGCIVILLVIISFGFAIYRDNTEPLNFDFKNGAECASVRLLGNQYDIYSHEVNQLVPYGGQKEVKLVLYQMPEEKCQHILVVLVEDVPVIDHRPK